MTWLGELPPEKVERERRTMKRKNAAAVSLGRKGGKANTPAQNAARRANGVLGGRPKTKQAKTGKPNVPDQPRP